MNTQPLPGDKKERSICLSYQDNKWKAFGYSAFYLASLFPEQVVAEEGEEMGVSLTDESLAMVLYAVEMSSVRVEDDRIEICL